MNEIVNAEYRIELPRTLPVIASEILQIERDVYANAMQGAIQIGQKLHEAKEQVADGEFVKWLNENLNYSQRQAYNFMEIADNYGDENSAYFNLQTSANLSISKALELLKVPEEEIENFVETHDVESDSVRELREEIKLLKQEKQDALAATAKAESELVMLADQKNDMQHKAEEYASACEELREMLKAEQDREPEAVDTAKLEELQNQLAAKENELKSVQEDFETLSSNMETQAKNAKEEVKRAFDRGEARGKQLADELAQPIKEENEQLKRKLENSQNQDKVKLGILATSLQQTFNECMTITDNMNGEDKANAVNALKTIINSMAGRLK